ncbi:hypothetical protein ACRQ1B_16415 [Rhizobium panacihumi]|uniref:hypothetical protein n=1 Tax=Rhizobium panacihumi TaxID=2008450 RepID=UPI003D7A8024
MRIVLSKVPDSACSEDDLGFSLFAHNWIALAFPYSDARVPGSKILSFLNGGILGRGRARIECWHWLAAVVEIECKDID